MLFTAGLWRYESSSEITMMGAAASAVMSWGAPTGKARLLHVAD
jgi:hypothetical protein